MKEASSEADVLGVGLDPVVGAPGGTGELLDLCLVVGEDVEMLVESFREENLVMLEGADLTVDMGDGARAEKAEEKGGDESCLSL